MLVAALLASVMAQSGLGGASPLGANPRVLISTKNGVRMSCPRGWEVVVDDKKRPPKGDFGDDDKFVVFEVANSKNYDGLDYTLRRDTENKSYMTNWMKEKPDPWKDSTKSHVLPKEFVFGKSKSFVTIGGKRVYVTFSMIESGMAITTRSSGVFAFMMSPKGKCYQFQLSLFEPLSKDAPTDHAAKVMKREYPIFVEMLKSISFE